MFKAEVCLSTELMDKDGYCTGKPEDFNDHGTIDTITASTLDDLIKQLKGKYNADFLNSLEVFEDQLETNRTGDARDYYENKKGKVCESWVIFISEVTSTSIDPSKVLSFIKK